MAYTFISVAMPTVIEQDAALTFDDELKVWLNRHDLSFGHRMEKTQRTRMVLKDHNITKAVTGKLFLPEGYTEDGLRQLFSQIPYMKNGDIHEVRVDFLHIWINHQPDGLKIKQDNGLFKRVISRCIVACRHASIPLDVVSCHVYETTGKTIENYEV